MSSSVGNNIPLHDGRPRSSSAARCGSRDDQLASWYQLVMEQPAPAGDPLEAKLELARFIVRRSHGDEAAQAAEAHFTRVVREGQAPEDVPEADAAGRRSGAPAGAPRGAPRHRLDQRGAPPDRPGRREGERRARDRARRAQVSARRSARPGREAAFCALHLRLTSGGESCASIPSWLPRRGCPEKVPLDTGAPFGRIGYDLGTEQSEGLWCKSEAFLCGQQEQRRSLKTQQRAFTSRPPRLPSGCR